MDTQSFTKRALLVGVNSYLTWGPLNGCLNDVERVQSLLPKYGFPTQNIATLLEKDATKENILQALEDFARITEKEDVFLFHFSGHGAQMDNKYKHNGTNESIVPADEDYILDDELQDALRKFRSRNVTLVMDSCHSGDVTRKAVLRGNDDAVHPITVRTVPKTFDVETTGLRGQNSSVHISGSNDTGIVTGSGWMEVLNFVLLAACRDKQNTGETWFNGKPYGILTHFLCTELESLPQEQICHTTWREIFDRVLLKYKKGELEEEPQLEGLRDWQIFGQKPIVPFRYILVHTSTDSIQLQAGFLHGVELNTFWKVYPLATKDRNSPSLPGTVKVVSVYPTQATLTYFPDDNIQETQQGSQLGTNPEVINMGRAICLSKSTTVVHVHLLHSSENRLFSIVGEISQQLSECFFIKLVRDVGDSGTRSCDFNLVITGTMLKVLNRDFCVLESLTAPLGEHRLFAANLEKIVFYSFANNRIPVMIPNCDKIRDNVRISTVTLNVLELRNGIPYRFDEVTSDESEISVKSGEFGYFSVEISDTAQYYITVLHFDCDYGIKVLYPPEGGHNAAFVGGARPLLIGAKRDPGGKLISVAHFYVPSLCEYQSNGNVVETIRFIVTTRPGDFSCLAQEGITSLKHISIPTLETIERSFGLLQLCVNHETDCDYLVRDITLTIRPKSRRAVLNQVLTRQTTWLESFSEQHFIHLQQLLLNDDKSIFRMINREENVKLLEICEKSHNSVDSDYTAVVFVHGSFLAPEEAWQNHENISWIHWVANGQFLSQNVRFFVLEHTGHHGDVDISVLVNELSNILYSLSTSVSLVFVAEHAGGMLVVQALSSFESIQQRTIGILFFGLNWLLPMVTCLDVLVSGFFWARKNIASQVKQHFDSIDQMTSFLKLSSEKIPMLAVVLKGQATQFCDLVGTCLKLVEYNGDWASEQLIQFSPRTELDDTFKMVFSFLESVVDPLTGPGDRDSNLISQTVASEHSGAADNILDSDIPDIHLDNPLELKIFSAIQVKDWNRVIEYASSDEAVKCQHPVIWYYKALAEINLNDDFEAIRSLISALVFHKEYNQDMSETLEEVLFRTLIGTKKERKRYKAEEIIQILQGYLDSQQQRELGTVSKDVLYTLYYSMCVEDPAKLFELKAVAWQLLGSVLKENGQNIQGIGCNALAVGIIYNKIVMKEKLATISNLVQQIADSLFEVNLSPASQEIIAMLSNTMKQQANNLTKVSPDSAKEKLELLSNSIQRLAQTAADILGTAKEKLVAVSSTIKIFADDLFELSPISVSRENFKLLSSSIMTLAESLVELGLHDYALRFYVESMINFELLQDELLTSKCWVSIGLILINQGKFFDALEIWEKAYAVAERYKDARLEIECLLNMGVAHRYMGNVEKALDILKQAKEKSILAGNRRLTATALDRMSTCYLEMQSYANANSCAEEMVTHVDTNVIQMRSNCKKASVLVAEGQRHWDLGNKTLYKECFGKAVAFWEDCLKTATEQAHVVLQLECLYHLMPLFCALENHSKMDESYREAMKVAEQLKDVEAAALFGYVYGRFQCYRGKYEECLQILLSAEMTYNEVARKAKKEEHIVKFRDSRGPALVNNLQQLSAILSGNYLGALELADRGRSRALLQNFGEGASLSWTEMRSFAQKLGVTFVVYTVSDEAAVNKLQVFGWVIRPYESDIPTFHLFKTENKPLQFRIFQDKDELVRSMEIVKIIDDEESEYMERLRRYHSMLWKPLLPWLPRTADNTVVVIPHRSVHEVPFASLIDEHGGYVVEKYTIAMAPSIALLQMLSKNIKLANQSAACVVGNPATSSINLKHAAAEAKLVAEMLHTKALLEGEATKSAVIEAMRKASIIHFACHGSLTMRQGGFMPGCLSFAEEKTLNPISKSSITSNTHILYADEVRDMDLSSTQIAFLSCCNTGRGEINTEGLLGLGRAFLLAKVKTVILTLWPVIDDVQMIDFVRVFYNDYLAHQKPASALRKAMLNAAKNGVPVEKWGSFYVLGLP